MQLLIEFLPKAEILLSAIDNLNTNTVSQDSLQQLFKNWPAEEYDSLLREADENPGTTWQKTEAYFIRLGQK